jgi:Lipoxygenase
MLNRPRFWLYRNLVALLQWRAFKAAEVIPLMPPVDGPVQFQAFAERHPDMPLRGLYEAVTYPAEDRAEPRLREIRTGKRVMSLLFRIAPRHTPPVPHDLERFLSVAYPHGFRRAWPTAPQVPPHLASPDADVLAELAVHAPFGSYLRRAGSGSGEDAYELDLRWMTRYQVRESLARPGGRALLGVRDGRLTTAAVHHDGVPPELARAVLIAGLNEDLTTFRHNLSIHLATLTSFALATTNELGARHPVRRLLHHCFHTVLIGNREVAEFQFAGARGFSATIFSHDAAELARMANDYIGRFDFWDFEPDTQFRNRGTTQTPFDYPYRDNVLRLWAETTAYVKDYLRLYYEGDDPVRDDAELVRWARELDRLVPNGVTIPDGGITFEWLARVCATLIHVSTVEHDVLNNIVWDYSTLGWIVPTVVPLSGETMDQRRAFDLIATIIGTWKPYNMLLTASVPSLALDERAAAVMRKWIGRLEEIQDDMANRPRDLSLSYPANLNVSISN